MHEVEERKNAHINELMRKHEKAFADIKSYYNEIAHNNLDLIKSLKGEVAEMKKKEVRRGRGGGEGGGKESIHHSSLTLFLSFFSEEQVNNEKLMYEIAQENKRLSEPLAAALKEGEVLRHTLTAYEKDKQSLVQVGRSGWGPGHVTIIPDCCATFSTIDQGSSPRIRKAPQKHRMGARGPPAALSDRGD